MNALAIALPAIDPVFAHSAAAVVGAVLLIGAADKLREPESWRDALENYRLLPRAAVSAFARTLPLLEIAAGVLLLPLATRQAGALLALALLAVFTAAIAINLARGRDRIDCGCGGHAHTPLSSAIVLRNVVLMLLVFGAAAPVLGRTTVWLDFVAAGFATLFLVGLYFLANSMLGRQSQLLDLRNSP